MKINYETMFILNPERDQEATENFLNDLKGLIERFDGEDIEFDDWGTRRLAYEIDKVKEGHYYLLNFKSETKVIPELEHFFRVTDGVMRYMVIRDKE